MLLLTCLSVLSAPLLAEGKRDLLRFEGQVILPLDTLSSKKRLILVLRGVDTPYSSQTWADPSGRFRFRDVTPGSYGLAIYIPDYGEIDQTVDITKSFADSKRTVGRRFEFTAQSLHSLVNSPPLSIISARQLSVPAKSNEEYRRAQNRLEHNDVDGALEDLKKAIAKAPQFVEALNYLGTISYQRREFPKAESYFRAALEQDPQAYEPLVNLGGTLLSEGRWREALAINQQARNTRPGDPLANAQLGLCYFAIGDYEHAIPWLLATEKLDPAHYTYPQLPLAEIYLSLADTTDAIRELQAFLRVHPDSTRAQNVRDAIVKVQAIQGEQSRQAEQEKHLSLQ